jgi:hypothetical protein
MEAAAKPVEKLPVLDLVTPIRAEQSRQKQRPARTGFIALQAPPPSKRRSNGLIRTIAAVAALLAVGVWYAGQQHETTNTVSPEASDAFSA